MTAAASSAASGRPLRAFALLVAAALLWFATRVPGLVTRYDAAMRGMRVPVTLAVTRSAIPRSRTLARRSAEAGATMPALVVEPPLAVTRAQAGAHFLPVPEVDPRLRRRDEGARPAAIPPSVPGNDPPPSTSPAYDLAVQAYARLAAGDRRAADSLFAQAITHGDSPNIENWRGERRRLNRRWSGDAYTLFRDTGAVGAAASPVLGGGQSGASLAWTIDPLARRPLAMIGRIYAAHDDRQRIDGETAQAAVGLRWQPRAGVSIAAERLVAVGKATSSDWNLRIAAGGEQQLGPGRLDAYGEAGVRGNGDLYAGGQARAALALGTAIGVKFSSGPVIWASAQSGAPNVGRVDLGIGITGRAAAGVAVSADWRWRIAGNAAPASGPAVTVSLGF